MREIYNHFLLPDIINKKADESNHILYFYPILISFMKITILVAFLVSSIRTSAQDRISGSYYDYFDNKLHLNRDSTFLHEFHFDLVYSWASGKYGVRNDTLYLTVIPVFDTIRYKNTTTDLITDSLILSTDQNSNIGFDSADTYDNGIRKRIYIAEEKWQNTFPIPDRLLYKKRKLFFIKHDGKLSRGRVSPIWPVRRKLGGNKKIHTWYIKRQEEGK